jgi:hypothetical protein
MIPERNLGLFTQDDENFFQSFDRFLRQPRQSIPFFPYARGDASGRQPPVPAPFLPTGRQLILHDTRQVGLIWDAGAARLEVLAGTKTSTIDSGRSAWAVVTKPGGASSFQIRSPDGALDWQFAVVDRAPAPPWFGDTPESLSEAQRMTRAAWLLEKAGPEWRAFAFGELADLAARGNFTAQEIWWAIRSGERRSPIPAQ